jgi:hypothetical protein
VAFTAFRQVTKEASRYLKLFEMRQQHTTGSHSEASSDPTGVHEMAFLIISDQYRIHDPIIWNVASDDELLTAIGPPFLPVPAPLPGAVWTAHALGNDPPRVDAVEPPSSARAEAHRMFPNIELTGGVTVQFPEGVHGAPQLPTSAHPCPATSASRRCRARFPPLHQSPAKRLNAGLPSWSSATISPSTIVSPGSFTQGARHTSKSPGEILVVSSPQLAAPPGLVTNRAKSVELQLVVPLIAFRRPFNALASIGSNEKAFVTRIQINE